MRLQLYLAKCKLEYWCSDKIANIQCLSLRNCLEFVVFCPFLFIIVYCLAGTIQFNVQLIFAWPPPPLSRPSEAREYVLNSSPIISHPSLVEAPGLEIHASHCEGSMSTTMLALSGGIATKRQHE